MPGSLAVGNGKDPRGVGLRQQAVLDQALYEEGKG